MHRKICHNYDIKTPGHCQEHHPESVVEVADVAILWDCSIITDRRLQAKRPDILIKDRKENVFAHLNVPSDRNISAKPFKENKQMQKPADGNRKMRHLKTKTWSCWRHRFWSDKQRNSQTNQQNPFCTSLQEAPKYF